MKNSEFSSKFQKPILLKIQTPLYKKENQMIRIQEFVYVIY